MDKAESYAKFRPKYPDETISKIVQPYLDREVITGIDVGAEPGIASLQLADKGTEMIAVKPNRAMIESAPHHPKVSYLHS